MTPRQIHERLAQDVESVCRVLLPGGKRIGSDWCSGSVGGEQGKSLKVRLNGNKAGIWADFANGQDKGDLIDLIRCVRGGTTAEAIRWAKDYAGIKDDDDPRFTPHAAKPKPLAPLRTCGLSDVCIQFAKSRKISVESLMTYRCVSDGNVLTLPCYVGDDLLFAKYADVTKPKKERFTCSPHATQVLFGWQAVDDNAREVVLTEGEFDALAYAEAGFVAMSIPMGAGTGAKQQWIENDWARLERFDTIYLSFDMDDAGKLTTEHVANRLGLHRCRIVTLPTKDANDALMQGVDLGACLRDARYLDPQELKTPNDFADAVYDAFYPSDDRKLGAILPWDYTQDKFRIRPGEVTVWTGINGHGKSLVLSHICVYLMHNDERVCVASMEMPAPAQLKRMLQQASGREQPDTGHIIRLLDWATGRAWIINIRGTAKTDRLLEVAQYAFKRYGVTNLIIDSLAKCGMAEDDYNGQKAFVERLTDVAMQTGMHIHLVAHARKGEDEFTAPNKMDIKGTGAITDMVDNVISVWRNKRKEDEVQRASYKGGVIPADVSVKPDCVLHVQKQRNFDWEGKIGLFFDKATHQYRTATQTGPMEYVI